MNQMAIEAILYEMTTEQRQGLTGSAARNILTNLWTAIEEQAVADVIAKQEACAKEADDAAIALPAASGTEAERAYLHGQDRACRSIAAAIRALG